MLTHKLGEFIGSHREELLRRCREKASNKSNSLPANEEIQRGIPKFLDDIVVELSNAPSKRREMTDSAVEHGAALFFEGFTVGQVVHDYGSVCQSVTELAVELGASITANDFRILNRCLDDGIANAVSEYSRQAQSLASIEDRSVNLRNLVATAINAFEVLQSGKVGVTGTTGALVTRCLLAIRALI